VPPLAAVPDLEQELDELYSLPLDEWTRARNDLAGRLKKAHQAEQAEQVRKLKKPTAVTWSVNQLARRNPEQVADLVKAGERLRAAQEQALRGKAQASDVGAASRAERNAVRELVAGARQILEESGNAATTATLDRVSRTLRTAAVDDAGRELLLRGRLDEELSMTGFGSLAGVRPARRPGTEERKAARERVNTLRAEARRLAKEAREAETEATRVERAAEDARAQADEKRREADAAATALAEAESALNQRG
jgi:hypothetical protein